MNEDRDNKYIVVRVIVVERSGGLTVAKEAVILFNRMIVHRHAVPKGMKASDVVAAGFFAVLPGGQVEAYGLSTSLGVSSRREVDAALIANMLSGR